jgi:hypothetical protein
VSRPGTAAAPATRCSASVDCCAAPDHHTNRSWTQLLAGLDAGDTHDEQLARTKIAAQYLRLIYHSPDRPRAEPALY